MKNRKKFYQDPWEVLDGYAPEVKLSSLPFLIVILLLFGGLGWYCGKHSRVQEFIKNLDETQQEGTLNPSPMRSEPTAEANAWEAMPTDTPPMLHRDPTHSHTRDTHFRIHYNATVKRFPPEDEDSEQGKEPRLEVITRNENR